MDTQMVTENTLSELTPLLGKPKKSRVFKRLVASIGIVLAGVLLLASLNNHNINLNASFPNLVEPLKLRIYTNNIRFDNNYNDPLEEKWIRRKKLITSSIDFHTQPGPASIVCLQEVLHNQLEDILYNLNNRGRDDTWRFYGVGRTNGKTKGEYAPILFKDSDWILLDNQTFWLSDTPSYPSRGWDAALERIVSMVTVQLKSNPLVKLNFFNTHFDHKGVVARRESSLLIINKMENYNEYPSFLCGDFNTQPVDEPYQILKRHGFKDSRTLIDKLHSYGHFGTFTGFDPKHEENSIIDYIWAPYFAKNANLGEDEEVNMEEDINFFQLKLHQSYKIAIKTFGILQSRFEYYMSDHRPVVADFLVERTFW